jgi:hypothetical protein
MKVQCRRISRPGAVLVAVAAAITAAAALTRDAAAEPPPPVVARTEPEPRCDRDQDLACTLVRETTTGVWVWTQRYRPAEPGNSGWTLSVGAGPPVPFAVTQFVATVPPPARPTPNGAPILE